ncbi:MAG: acetolactate synthase, large subunit, biosynthetic type, partial [Lachnospiraceae bacterium]|nr:acetolactate synthase, large subunit, biosynthetic type [Lachnospiraceae bacterium]
MIGADAIVKCLELEGVKNVYGYPGVAICPFYNSILDSDIRTVLVRTEQNAAHMASGEARISGKPGVCAVTSGPGATNVITGIATAFADSIPMIIITGQVNSELLGSDVFQEADITGAVESFVKYSYLVKDAQDIPRIMKEAFYIASTGRKGPVLIDVPIDIQNQALKNFHYPDEVNLRTYKPTFKGNAAQIKKVIKELKGAKKPIICAGGGVFLANADDELQKFAEEKNIPVVSTMMGIGVLPTAHPLYFGMVGNNGKPYANKAMNDADVIIMIGARVADRAVNRPELISNGNKTLIHMDVDPAEIGKNALSTIPLVGDAEAILEELTASDIDGDYSAWVKELTAAKKAFKPNRKPSSKYVDPAEFVKQLTTDMIDGSIYVADVGQNQIWSCANIVIGKGRMLTSG